MYNRELAREQKETWRYERIMLAAVLVLLAVGSIIIWLDSNQLSRVFEQAKWNYALYALGAVAVVFLAQAGSYVIINRVMGIDLDWPYLLVVGLVSIAIGNVVSVVGTAEHVIRSLLIVPRGYKIGHVVSASVVHAYIKDLAILVLVPVGLAILLPTHSFSMVVFTGLIGLGIGAMALLALTTASLFVTSLRRWFLGIAARAWHYLGRIIPPMRRHKPDAELARFDREVARGARALRNRPGILIPIMALMFTDWIFTLATVELAFLAFNNYVSTGVLMSGFALGKVSGIISFIPGGLGIITASMAGAYSLLGVPFETAVLVAVFYRVVTHYLPYILSFISYSYLRKHISS